MSVIVNGKASSSFPTEHGCCQSDPILHYLFILCAEVSACKISEDTEIKGIDILDSKFKISQFADDTSLILEGDSKSYEKLFGVLGEFENILGLKLNYEKKQKKQAMSGLEVKDTAERNYYPI